MSIDKEVSVATQSERLAGNVPAAQFNQSAANQLHKAMLQIEATQEALKKTPATLLDQAGNTREKLATVHAENIQKLAEKNGKIKQKLFDSAEEAEATFTKIEADIATLNKAAKKEAKDFAAEIQKDWALAKEELKDFGQFLSDDLEQTSSKVKNTCNQIQAEVAEQRDQAEDKWARKREQRKLDELVHRAKKSEENAEECIVNVLQALMEADFACMVALEAQTELEEARNQTELI